MKKLFKKLYKLIIILFLITFLFPYSTVLGAVSTEYAGQAIASFAINFYENHKDETIYCLDGYSTTTGHRQQAYMGIKAHSYNGQMYYGMDCVGWVNFVIHNATGMTLPSLTDSFVTPQRGPRNGFAKVSGTDLKPGDIIVAPGGPHVMVYVGNGEIVDSISSKPPGIARRKFSSSSYSKMNWYIARITDSGASGVSEEQCSEIYDGLSSGTISFDSATGVRPENTSIYNEQGFVYQGMPESVGYTPMKIGFSSVWDSLGDIVDWLIGKNTYLLRAVTIGYTAIVENLIIDGIFDFVTGTDKIDESKVSDKDALQNKIEEVAKNATDDGKPSITVEKMVFNQVPFLDVNMFNFETAGGEPIIEGSVIYTVRTNIAAWYYAFRAMAIAIMLVVLLYLGFRLIFNSIAEKKAVYKQMLWGWVVGFILLFSIHYLMVFILQANETILKILVPTIEDDYGTTLYDTVRLMAYEVKASTGWAGTIIYIVLVYYAIRFLYTYLKRLLHIIILIILAPIVALSYAIEKVNKKGAKAPIYGNWLKDFTLTVTMQSIHALIYTVFIGTVLNLTRVSLVGIILAFVFLNFMLQAEKLFHKIFGFGSGTDFGKGIRPSLVAGGFFATKAGKYYKNYAKSVTKPVTGTANRIGEHSFNAIMRKMDKNFESTRDLENLNDGSIKKLENETEEEFKKRKQEFETAQKNRKDAEYRRYEKIRNNAMKSAAKLTLNSVKNTGMMVLSLPTMIAINPEAGFVVLGRAISGYQNLKKTKYKAIGLSSRQNRRKIYSIMFEYSDKKDQTKVLRQALNYMDSRGIDYRVHDNGLFVYDKETGTWKKVSKYKKAYKTRYDYTSIEDHKSNKQKFMEKLDLYTGLNLKPEKGYKNDDYLIDDSEKIEFLDENGNVINVQENLSGKVAKGARTVGKVLLALNGMAFVDDIAEIADQYQLDIDDQRENAKIIQDANKKEDELIKKYREIMDNKNLIKTANETELATRVRERTVTTFNNNVQKLVDPIDFEDIKQAVENYKENSDDDVKDRINHGNIEKTDYIRIAEEINKVLENNGEDRRVNEEIFTDNIAIAVEATRHKNEHNIREMDKRLRNRKGLQDNSPVQNSAGTEEESATSDSILFGTNIDNSTNENQTTDINELIGIMQSATNKPQTKYFEGVTVDEYRIANIIDDMKEINKKADEKMGRKIWNIQRITDRLKTHYENNDGYME